MATVPSDFTSTTFVDPEQLNSNKIWTRILQVLNQLFAWARTVPQFTSPSGVVLGTFDVTKPVQRAVGYVESTTDGSGNKIVSTFPAGTTAVLSCDLTTVFRVSPQTLGPIVQLRLDASSIAAGLTFQWRAPSTGATLATTQIAYIYDVHYQ